MTIVNHDMIQRTRLAERKTVRTCPGQAGSVSEEMSVLMLLPLQGEDWVPDRACRGTGLPWRLSGNQQASLDLLEDKDRVSVSTFLFIFLKM